MNGTQVTSEAQKVRGPGNSSQTRPSAGLQEAGRACEGPATQAAAAGGPLCFKVPALEPSLEQGTEPGPPEPSGKVWTHWQENRVLSCVCYVNRCEKEVGQTVGVVILTGCVPLIIRKLLHTAAFHQLNYEKEKIKSSLEQRDGPKHTSWGEGACARVDVRASCSPQRGEGQRTGSSPFKF